MSFPLLVAGLRGAPACMTASAVGQDFATLKGTCHGSMSRIFLREIVTPVAKQSELQSQFSLYYCAREIDSSSRVSCDQGTFRPRNLLQVTILSLISTYISLASHVSISLAFLSAPFFVHAKKGATSTLMPRLCSQILMNFYLRS